MYQSLVKLMGNKGLLGIKGPDQDKAAIHKKDKMCCLLQIGRITNLKDNTEVIGTVVQANQTVVVRPELNIVTTRYHTIVSYNPELSLAGLIITPLSPIVRAGEKDRVGLVIRASKKVDLADFEHAFELYQID